MKRALLLLCALSACKPPAPPPPAASKPPAVVAKEGDLLTVTLTKDAEERLGIRTADAELKRIPRVRQLGGTTEIPPGLSVVVSAPLAGTLGVEMPQAGKPVAAGSTVFTLSPYLTAESKASLAASQIEADGALATAKVQADAGKVEVDRAERLLADKAGSQKAVDEAKARREGALAAYKAAQARRDVLAAALSGRLDPLPLASPIDGTLRRLHAAAGQRVNAGAPLFEVAAYDRLWVRVPVYVGDLPGIDATKKIAIDGLEAAPMAAPPSADPLTATGDLVYAVDNSKGGLRPGQKVTVPLPLKSDEDSLVLPASAIVHDLQGGAWVYERVAEQKFVRRRVSVRHVTDGLAALASGPKAGAKVVVAGALEIYGIEFGHAK